MIILDRVVTWLAQQGVPAYLVGGCIRDRLLGRPVYDLDVAVGGDGLELARRLANRFSGAYYPLDQERSTGRAVLSAEGQDLVVDIARFRGPDLSAQGLPFDLADRDFTVNALASDVNDPDQVIDLHGGLADLSARVIRPVSEWSIRNDPLRALRAVRLAAELSFTLVPETELLLRRDGPGLERVSDERIRDELARLLALPGAAPYLRQLDGLGLLTQILPELEPLRGLVQPPPHHLDGLAHSLETVDALEQLVRSDRWTATAQPPRPVPCGKRRLPPDELAPFADRLGAHLHQPAGGERRRLVTLKLAGLMHDVGKPATHSLAPTLAGSQDEGRVRFIGHDQDGAAIAGRVFRRLRFGTAEARLAETIVRHHMRPLLLAGQGQVSARAVYRFFRDTGDAGVDVLLHALADHCATYDPSAGDPQWPGLVALTTRMLSDYYERRPERVSPPPLIDGHDLLREFGLERGPQIGELLEAVREAQASGEVQTRAEALSMVRERLNRED